MTPEQESDIRWRLEKEMEWPQSADVALLLDVIDELRAVAAKTADLLTPAPPPPPAVCPDDDYAYGVPYAGEISYAMHPDSLAELRASLAAAKAINDIKE